MKLGKLGQADWTVLAVCRDDHSCPVIEFIATLDARRGARVLYDLQAYVPSTRPADWVRTRFSAALAGSDGIYEFRWPTRGGGTPRVFWFYDEGQVIVCSHGLDKKGEMSRTEVQYAQQVRRAYLGAKATGHIEILEFNELSLQSSPRKS